MFAWFSVFSGLIAISLARHVSSKASFFVTSFSSHHAVRSYIIFIIEMAPDVSMILHATSHPWTSGQLLLADDNVQNALNHEGHILSV